MLLFKLISYLSQQPTPISLEKLLSDLSLDTIPSELYTPYFDPQNRTVSLNKATMSRVCWLTPTMMFHRDTQQLVFARSSYPLESDVMMGLKPLLMEQGLLIERVDFLMDSHTDTEQTDIQFMSIKIQYAPVLWDAKARQAIFVGVDKTRAEVNIEMSTLQANDDWETWHCYRQHAFTPPKQLKTKAIEKIMDLLQKQYGFQGLVSQLISDNKISTFIPYSNKHYLYLINTENEEKRLGLSRTSPLTNLLKKHHTYHLEANFVSCIGFLPHFIQPEPATTPSPLSVAAVETSSDEHPLWLRLSVEEIKSDIWICETEAGRFTMRQLIPSETARNSLCQQLLNLSTPDDSWLHRQTNQSITFFSPPKSSRKTVVFSTPEIVSTDILPPLEAHTIPAQTSQAPIEDDPYVNN